MKIRRLADGQVFEGPDGTEVPGGFALVPPEAARPGGLERVGQSIAHPLQAVEAGRAERAANQGMIGKVADAIAPSLGTSASMVLTGGGGALAAKALPAIPKLAGALGRAGTQGAIEATEAAVEGKSPIKAGIMGAASALLPEGILGLVSKAKIPFWTKSISNLIEQFGDREKAYKLAREAVKEAFDKVRPAVRNVRLSVPAIDSTKKLTLKEVEAGMGRLEGVDFDVAREQIKHELDRLDLRNLSAKMRKVAPVTPKSPGPYAGSEFAMRTPLTPRKPTPMLSERAAMTTAGVMPAVAAAADVGVNKPKAEGVPFGVLAETALMRGAGGLARRYIPGARAVESMMGAEEVEGGGGG